jgi:cytochrome b pre-mRNA-processing protein 3
MLKSLFGTPDGLRAGETLYFQAVEQARQPFFYTDLNVPDTVDGRFDMIATHVFLILHRLKAGGDRTQTTSQALFDAMFSDMDRGLREMGAGDLGVGRRVKTMANAFYGRVAAYDQGLEPGDTSLTDAVLRNVFRSDEKEREAAKRFAAYISAQSAALSAQDLDSLLAGNVDFVTIAEVGRGAELS